MDASNPVTMGAHTVKPLDAVTGINYPEDPGELQSPDDNLRGECPETLPENTDRQQRAGNDASGDDDGLGDADAEGEASDDGGGADKGNKTAEESDFDAEAEAFEEERKRYAKKKALKPQHDRDSGAPSAIVSNPPARSKGKERLETAVEAENSEGESEIDLLDNPDKASKARGKAKKSKVKVKEEDLDPSSVTIASKTQAELDATFLGFVRIQIVDPDPTVEHIWQTVNQREIDAKHRKNIKESLERRKVDWDFPLHVLISAKQIDPRCLSKSVYPVEDLKPIVWTCPPGERRINYLSGNHRCHATADYHSDLVDRKTNLEEQLDIHVREQAAGGQTQIMVGGILGSELEGQLRTQIAVVGDAANEAKLWTLTVYDEERAIQNTTMVALLATNEPRPSKAADNQEEVHMMAWRLFKQIDTWRERHQGQDVPVPGTRAFRSDILNVAITDNELKKGTANFLFTQADNLLLIQDLWQLPYFKVARTVPLSRLELALGKVGKKDLSKKSGSAMVWRWLVHQLMRDLRLVGTTDRFPDADNAEDDLGCLIHNYKTVLEVTNDSCRITEDIWIGAGFPPEEDRSTASAMRSAQAYARKHAATLYHAKEDKLVEFHKLSQVVWDTEILTMLDDMYETAFRVSGANKKFGSFDSPEWTQAMDQYREAVMEALPQEWERRIKTVGKGMQARKDAAALRQAKAKLQWLQVLQQHGGRELDAPFLCGKLLEDFSQYLLDAESGFKLVTRTLDPLVQIGLLRLAPSEGDESRVVYTDFLSYLVAFFNDPVKFKFGSTADIEAKLSVWLLRNLPLITTCGKKYQSTYVDPEHELVFALSMNQINNELSKLHTKADKHFLGATSFPTVIQNAMQSVTFRKKDFDAVIDIYKVLWTTAARVLETTGGSVSSSKLNDKERESMKLAANDLMGRILPSLSLAHVSKYPCLAMLYRHALTWQVPEFGVKTGKENGFLAYAYILHITWRVYGDTIGRMIPAEIDYLNLRKSLFTFLGSHSQPRIEDYMGPSTRRPPGTRFANWDHELLGSFVDRHGRPIKNGNSAGGTGGAIIYSPRSVKVFDAARMAKHTASIKKAIDGLGKCALALGPKLDSAKATTAAERGGPWSPEVVSAARDVALAMIRNALKAEFEEELGDSGAPYIDVEDEDLEQFLPALPKVGQEPPDTYPSLLEFALRQPKRYRLYCHGLVAEGYEDGRGHPSASAVSSGSSSVRRKSAWKSGSVYPQDLNYKADWAKVSIKSLKAANLPDPISKAKPGISGAIAQTSGKRDAPASSSSPKRNDVPRAPNMQHGTPSQPRAADVTPPSSAQSPTGVNIPVRGGVSSFPVKPRGAGRARTTPAPANADEMDIDEDQPPLPAQPVQALVASHAHVHVPSSSPLTPLPEDRMNTDPIVRDLATVSSPLPELIPNIFSAEPTQHPAQPPSCPSATETRQLDRPSEEEVAAFEQLVKLCDGERFGCVLRNALDIVSADPTFGAVNGEMPPLELRYMFWALVRDAKEDSVGDEVFKYIRDDHPSVVNSDLLWEDFLRIYQDDGAGWNCLQGCTRRFRDRHEDHMAPIYDVDRNGREVAASANASTVEAQQSTLVRGGTTVAFAGNHFMMLWDKIKSSNHHSARAEPPHSGRKRERSQSIVDDTRAGGDSSPPKHRPKRASELSSPTRGQRDGWVDDSSPPAAAEPTTRSTRSSTATSRSKAAERKVSKHQGLPLDAVEEETAPEMAGEPSGHHAGKPPAVGRRVEGKRMV